jgi:hypothetical protein
MLTNASRGFTLFNCCSVEAAFRVVELRARTPFGPWAFLNWIRAIRPFAFRTRALAKCFLRYPKVTIADEFFSIIERAYFMKPKRYFAAKDPIRPLRWSTQTASPNCDGLSGDSRAVARSGAVADKFTQSAQA